MSEGEKPLVNKALRVGAAALVAISTIAGGCTPEQSPLKNPVTPTANPSPESAAATIEPYKPTQEDKTTFLTTLGKYLNLDADFSLNERFQVFPYDPASRYTSSSRATTYIFEGIQLSIGKDEQGKVTEEILLLNLNTAGEKPEAVAKKILKIQPPRWEPIGPVNLNNERKYLGIKTESTTAEGYTRISLYEGGRQLEIIFRTTPFPK